jgi:hypothetical protein
MSWDELRGVRWWLNVLIAAALVMGTWMAVALFARKRQMLAPLHPLDDRPGETED